MTPSIREYLKKQAEWFETESRNLFPAGHPEVAVLREAMDHSFKAGGKRIRPVLALTVAAMLDMDATDILPAALAIEMIHTYSLIHDDLPAMDDDDFRRGKPTCHKVYGDAMAILAGDGLLTEAFHVAAVHPDKPEMAAGKLRFIKELADAAGIRGMVGGQVMDMEHPENGDESYLTLLHNRKTGAMIRISCMAPVLVVGAPESFAKAIDTYARKIGLLFQVTDDMLDETASLAELGKTPGKDREQGKLTYPALFGLNGARKLADRLQAEAEAALAGITDTDRLIQLARFIRERSH